MADTKKWLHRFNPGTVKAVIFIILIGVAIAIWLYTQLIFHQVREFQKSVVRTQVAIYVNIIDPTAPDVGNLFDYIKDSPLPRIITDKNNNPIEGLWQNVGIHPDSTDEISYHKLRNLIEIMDEVNSPESFPSPPHLKHMSDTLTVYEFSPSQINPVAVTDTLGTLLYSRIRTVDPADTARVLQVIKRMDAIAPPLLFSKDHEPPLVFHGVNVRNIWPILIVKQNGEPVYWHDVNVAWNDTSSAGREKLEAFAQHVGERGIVYTIATDYDEIVYDTWLFHYGDVAFLSWIAWLPVIEFVVLLILLLVGFIGFRNIMNAEQRSIWVGMAKETAHQLGTPISSLGGWLELLKSDRDEALVEKSLPEMEYDVERLTRVAARFSSIGSIPELKPIALSDVIDEVLDYYRARVPQMGASVSIGGHYKGLRHIMGSRELLNWAFENLVKNSFASIETREGVITVTGSMTKDFSNIILDFSDNGKGIPLSDQKKVMRPGFTTKKRGWGLGLNLVKRIIEDYHNGKVFLLESRPDIGTTFRVILPAVKNGEG